MIVVRDFEMGQKELIVVGPKSRVVFKMLVSPGCTRVVPVLLAGLRDFIGCIFDSDFVGIEAPRERGVTRELRPTMDGKSVINSGCLYDLQMTYRGRRLVRHDTMIIDRGFRARLLTIDERAFEQWFVGIVSLLEDLCERPVEPPRMDIVAVVELGVEVHYLIGVHD